MSDISISVDGNYADANVIISSNSAKIEENSDSAAAAAVAADLAVLQTAVTALENSTIDADERATLQASLDTLKAKVYANPGASSGPLYCNLSKLGNFSIQNMCKVQVMDPSMLEFTNSLNLLKAYVGFYLGKYNGSQDLSQNAILDNSWKQFQFINDAYMMKGINMWYQSFLKKHGSNYNDLMTDANQEKYFNAALYGQQCICTNSNPTNCAYSIACNLACGKIPTLNQFTPVNLEKLIDPYIFNQSAFSGMVATMPYVKDYSKVQNAFVNPLSIFESMFKIATLGNTVTLKYHVNEAGLPDPFSPHEGNPKSKQYIESGWLGITSEELSAEQKLVKTCYTSEYSHAKPYLDLFSDGVGIDISYESLGPIDNNKYKNLKISDFKKILSNCEDSITLTSFLMMVGTFGMFELDAQSTYDNMKKHNLDVSNYEVSNNELLLADGSSVNVLPHTDSFWKLTPVYKLVFPSVFGKANEMNGYLAEDLSGGDLSGVALEVETFYTIHQYTPSGDLNTVWQTKFGSIVDDISGWYNNTEAAADSNAKKYKDARQTLLDFSFNNPTKIAGQDFDGPSRVRKNTVFNYPPSTVNLKNNQIGVFEYVYVDISGYADGSWNVQYTPFLREDISNQILKWGSDASINADVAKFGTMGQMMFPMLNAKSGSFVSAGAWALMSTGAMATSWQNSALTYGTISSALPPKESKYFCAEFGMLTYLTCCMEGSNLASRLGPFAKATMVTGCNKPNKLASLEPFYFSLGGKKAIDAGYPLPSTFLPRDPSYCNVSNPVVVSSMVEDISETYISEPTSIPIKGVQCIASVNELMMMMFPAMDYTSTTSETMIENLTGFKGEGSMMRNRLEEKPELLSYILSNLYSSASLLVNIPDQYNSTVYNTNYFGVDNSFPTPEDSLDSLATTTFANTGVTDANIATGMQYFDIMPQM